MCCNAHSPGTHVCRLQLPAMEVLTQGDSANLQCQGNILFDTEVFWLAAVWHFRHEPLLCPRKQHQLRAHSSRKHRCVRQEGMADCGLHHGWLHSHTVFAHTAHAASRQGRPVRQITLETSYASDRIAAAYCYRVVLEKQSQPCCRTVSLTALDQPFPKIHNQHQQLYQQQEQPWHTVL